jgi:hypothetical protein
MSIWDKYPNYDENELKLLVRVTTEVLAGSAADVGVSDDFLEMSDKSAAEEIRKRLADAAPNATSEQIRKLVTADMTAKEISLRVLDEVRKQPELASAVAAAYEKHTQKLGGPVLLLALAPLLVALLRIDKIDIRKEAGDTGKKSSVVIKFNNVTDVVKGFMAGLVSGVLGKGSGGD